EQTTQRAGHAYRDMPRPVVLNAHARRDFGHQEQREPEEIEPRSTGCEAQAGGVGAEFHAKAHGPGRLDQEAVLAPLDRFHPHAAEAADPALAIAFDDDLQTHGDIRSGGRHSGPRNETVPKSAVTAAHVTSTVRTA